MIRNVLNIGRRIFSSKNTQTAKTILENKAIVPRTNSRPSLPGKTLMDGVFGDNLVVHQTENIANGVKKTTAVYSSQGKHIGKGGDQGLCTFRETTTIRKPGESVFGGDIIEIQKVYKDTMAEAGRTETIVKHYTKDGVAEHIEKTIKHHHSERAPKTTIIDRTKMITGETAYSEALKEKKAAENAIKTAQKEAVAAAKKLEAEELAKLPRVNVGKVFNKNIDEFKMVREQVMPDGTVVRNFTAKGKNGKTQHIVTYDKGSFHKEMIINPDKDMTITYEQLGKEAPTYKMKKGYGYHIEYKKDYFNETYTDGQHLIISDRRGTVSCSDTKRDRMVSQYRGPLLTEYKKLDGHALKEQKAIEDKIVEIVSDANKQMEIRRENLFDLWRPYNK